MNAREINENQLLYMFASALVTIPYLMWHKRRHTGAASPVAPAHRV